MPTLITFRREFHAIPRFIQGGVQNKFEGIYNADYCLIDWCVAQ